MSELSELTEVFNQRQEHEVSVRLGIVKKCLEPLTRGEINNLMDSDPDLMRFIKKMLNERDF